MASTDVFVTWTHCCVCREQFDKGFNPGAVDLPLSPALAEDPWQAPLPSLTSRQRNIFLPPL